MSTRIIHFYNFYKVRIVDEHDHHATRVIIEWQGPPNNGVSTDPIEVSVHYDHHRNRWKAGACYNDFPTIDDLAKFYIHSNPELEDLGPAHHHH